MFRSIFTLLWVLMVIGPAFADPNPTAERVDLLPGDSWKFIARDGRFSDGEFSYVVTGRNENGYTLDATSTSKIMGVPTSLSLDLNRVFRGNDSQWLSFPMAVGKTWSATVPWVNFRGSRGEDKVTFKVAAHEKVKVAAGEFNAFRIEGKGRWSTGTYGDDFEVSIWYAPDALHVVKYERKNWPQNSTQPNFELSATTVTPAVAMARPNRSSPSAVAPVSCGEAANKIEDPDDRAKATASCGPAPNASGIAAPR